MTIRSIRRASAAVLCIAALAATTGLASAGDPVAAAPDAPLQSMPQPDVSCTCRFSGRDYQLGETACIRGAIATCTTFLNNTSWTMSTSPCPVSLYDPDRGAATGS